ncbi:MAG: TauD/TfdA family dioxygenase [Novosphingobium sp.]|nr:TauD/TfdA family dioxygenase [Novosphingobium sp.]
MNKRQEVSDNWISEAGLRWRPLVPFGAEIDHDLALPLSAPAADRFYQLLDQEGLIVARGQTLGMDRQKAISAPIGPDIHRAHAHDTGYITTEGVDQGSARSELSFHSDNAYTDKPLAAISLHAVDVVDDASGTLFVNAEHAYETLPTPLRDRLDALTVEMVMPSSDCIGRRVCDVREPAVAVSAPLPAVRVNSRTGRRYIGVSEMQTARVLDMDWDEGRALLHEVYDHLYAPENRLEHRWRGGDIVLWDNLTLQHARGSLADVGRRVLQRVVAASS